MDNCGVVYKKHFIRSCINDLRVNVLHMFDTYDKRKRTKRTKRKTT